MTVARRRPGDEHLNQNHRVRLRTILLLVVAGCIAAVPSAVNDDTSARDYLDEANDILVQNAYYASRIDPRQAQAVIARGSAATSMRDVYSSVASLVSMLRDRHSLFLEPAAVRAILSGSPHRVLPSGGSLSEGIGLLRLPPTLAGPATEEALDYVERAWAVFREARLACSWIVDLRGNNGGTTAPMIAAVAPLLGGGHALGYLRREGIESWWSVGEDRVTFGDETALVFGRTPPSRSRSEVAVLTDGRTASAAEGVLIALLGKGARSVGSRTAGVPTGTELFILDDGAGLLLATGVMMSPRGHVFEGSIPPSLYVRDDLDPTLQAVSLLPPCN